jgi:hypothetical protein
MKAENDELPRLVLAGNARRLNYKLLDIESYAVSFQNFVHKKEVSNLAEATGNSIWRAFGKTRHIKELRTRAQANQSPHNSIVQFAQEGM